VNGVAAAVMLKNGKLAALKRRRAMA